MMDMDIQEQLFSGNIGFPSSNPQDFAMENNICGFNRFSFSFQQKHEKPLQYQQSMQYQHPQIPSFQNHQGINLANDQQMVSFSQNFASLAEKQRLEIDRLIILQNERLKWALQEQRKQQLSLILKKYEAKMAVLLGQKDEEIAKAVNKTNELQDFLKRVENENQTWQKIAKENEEMVFSLNNTIEHLRESACLSANVVEDTESCCDDVFKNRGIRAIESMQCTKVEALEQISKKVICKGCNIRSSCIIILPCSHLCLCESCEAFLHSCPLCGTQKKATIQALI
ncbi:hypothetical protein LIER_32120 [Lithospermum erythrorhizon]|uniref:Uncharacterized protein n=1 Tax=Lithospermum erythrorhizon TaxID=34254 RepID=A0AAV3RWZ1_LITER